MSKDRMKIGILTLNGYNNHGNRLQNYATQEVIRNLGFEVETILVDRRSSETSEKLTKRMALMSIGELYSKVCTKISNRVNKKLIEERKNAFVKFTRSYIRESDFVISKNNIPRDLSNRYEYFISGSDQVWNPNNQHGTSFYFLDFAERKKRISYAASFGLSQIPVEYMDRYKIWLTEMHRISVREESGAKIVKELTGRVVDVLVDPTLMLTKSNWLNIAKESKGKPMGKYILLYFLGKIPKNVYDTIHEIAKKNKMQIVNLSDITSKKIYTSGPSEFIDFINSASLLCTDSFHGTVFSILMETPFIVFERESKGPSMFSRIDTLLTTFKLDARKWNDSMGNDAEIFQLDFTHIAPILEVQRNKAIMYLKEALSIKDNK